MEQTFRYFVILADMRTGSNLLEANINAFTGLHSFGEAFNPAFPGYPNNAELLGVTLEQRIADPLILLDRIKAQQGILGGFRYFRDHEPRLFETIMQDPDCAKIILTRNPVESYVSLKIARATGQWKLTNVKRRKAGTIHFDAVEFADYLDAVQTWQSRIQEALQVTGQTAFYISYDDLNNIEIINGLAWFLGCSETREQIDQKLKPQNPDGLQAKVENFDEMCQSLNALDLLGLSRRPNFEPKRGPMVNKLVTCAYSPLIYFPLPGGPVSAIQQWMAALDGVRADRLGVGHGQPKIRKWLSAHPDHRKFTVLRHPLARAHAVFCRKILSLDDVAFPVIRKQLRNFYKVPLPGNPDHDYSVDDHRNAFAGFLGFLKQNLALQTGIRVDAHWASQLALLQSMSQFALPDMILREADLETGLRRLACDIGRPDNLPDLPQSAADTPYTLDEIYDSELEALAFDAYAQDYEIFGFEAWR